MYSKLLAAVALIGSTMATAIPPKYNNVPDTSCGNAGVKFDIYPKGSPFGAKVPLDWHPNSIDSQHPEVSGVRSGDKPFGWEQLHTPVGGSTPFSGSIYESKHVDLQHVIVKHTGFFYAAEAGEYTITLSRTDDAAYFFAGTDCYKKATATVNGLAQVSRQLLSEHDVHRKIKVDQPGTYVQFDWRGGNVMGGPGSSFCTIKKPNGDIILGPHGPTGSGKGMLVHKICKPNYPVWGYTGAY